MFTKTLSLLGCVLAVLLSASVAVAESPNYPELNKPAVVQKTGNADVAVIVAVEDYVFLPDVGGATANGNDWEKFFQDSLGVQKVHFVSNAQATKEELERFAKLAADNSQPGGTVWFVFIGHGAPSKNGAEGLLVGSDARQDPNSLFARGMPQQALLDILQTGQQAQTVLVVDACFSGRAGDGSALAPAQPVIPTTIIPKVTSNTVVLTAAQASEFAGSLPGLDRPAFSYLLLGALRGWAANSGTVTAENAQRFVERSLRGIPGRMTQTPSIHGNSDVVLARGVVETDPGISDIMRKLAREPKKGVVQPLVGPTIIKPVITGGGNGVPVLPQGLNPKGAISLSVDAEVLVARDQALRADENGQNDPDAAARAWRGVAEMGGANPFKEEAATRAGQWEDFAQKQRDLLAQKSSDFERLKKILPLTSVANDNKVELLQNYASLYGEDDLVELIRNVEPADFRHSLCAPYILRGTVPVTATMPYDREGNPFKGKIEVAGQVLGTAPATFSVPACAELMGIKITEVESGKIWTGAMTGISTGTPTIIEPSFEELMPYSIWHDYIWADAPGGPLLGMMYSQMNFPEGHLRETAQQLRGNVELSVGHFGSHLSLWFEPSMILAEDGQDPTYGYAGGVGLGRFTSGRFSLSPIRVGYQKYTDAELDGVEGATGHAALRFHVGKGFQLRGDAGIMRTKMTLNGVGDQDAYIWSAGGGLEYGHPIISNAVGSVLGDSDTSYGDDEWAEWTYGSMSMGYKLESGFLLNQDAFGTFVFHAHGADSYEGGYFEFSGAFDTSGGLGSSSLGLRMGMATLGDDEDFLYTIGFITGYTGYEESSYYMLGGEMTVGWHLFSQLSFNLYGALNALALADMSEETVDPVTGEVTASTSAMSPVAAYMRWVTPWNVYANLGARYGLGDPNAGIGGFAELGYLWSLE